MTDRLHLSKRQWLAPTDDGFVLGRRAQVLRHIRGGRELTEILDAITTHLEVGPASLDDLCGALEGRFHRALLTDAVHQFLSLGILERTPVARDGQPDPVVDDGPMYRYLSEQADDPAVRLGRLKNSRVLVHGGGQLADWTATALRESGIECVDRADQAGLVDPDDLGQRWSTADLVIACADDPTERLRLFPRLNAVHLRQTKPWLVVYVDGDKTLLGPLFVPNETGCYRCLELREESRLPHRAEFLAFKRHLTNRWEIQRGDYAPPAARIASGAAAMEAVRILSYISFPATFRTMIAIDLRSFETEFHTLLRVPFCDACGPHVTRPFRKLWSV